MGPMVTSVDIPGKKRGQTHHQQYADGRCVTYGSAPLSYSSDSYERSGTTAGFICAYDTRWKYAYSPTHHLWMVHVNCSCSISSYTIYGSSCSSGSSIRGIGCEDGKPESKSAIRTSCFSQYLASLVALGAELGFILTWCSMLCWGAAAVVLVAVVVLVENLRAGIVHARVGEVISISIRVGSLTWRMKI